MASSPSAQSGEPPLAPRWIEGPWTDLLLYIGTPALILPLVLGLERAVPAATIYYVVAAFGALGHHLPGMMRAYGDRALFRRFRVRFIVAPIFLLVACIGFELTNRSPMVVVAYVWGIWHGLMQTHGILRIYDAKQQSFGRYTAQLDQWMCLAWFGVGVFFSPTRLTYILEAFNECGGPAVPLQLIEGARAGWALLTLGVTLAFLWNLIRESRAGRPPNPAKLLLLATSISFWIYSNVVVSNILVGILLFELFHDVQYLSIVWHFNRSRVERDPDVGSFSRFLFRPRAAMLGVYVAMVLAYGSIGLLKTRIPVPWIESVLIGAITASTLLHFYFDGFIWKLRERDTREALGLEGGTSVIRPSAGVPPWLVHGLKWSLLVVPLVVLASFRLGAPATALAYAETIAGIGPKRAVAQYNYGVALRDAGQTEAALERFERARALDSGDGELGQRIDRSLAWIRADRADALVREGRSDAAREVLGNSLELLPSLTNELNLQTADRARAGDWEGAEASSEVALLIEPDSWRSHFNLAQVLYQTNRLEEATAHARESVRLGGGANAQKLLRVLEQRSRSATGTAPRS
jgi:hypothetical protein